MFIRIVKMTFREDEVETFLENFNVNKQSIRNFKGCTHLELLRDKNHPSRFFTYSYWENDVDLENYRHSDLFKGVWRKTKPLFSEPAEAWSVDRFMGVWGEE